MVEEQAVMKLSSKELLVQTNKQTPSGLLHRVNQLTQKERRALGEKSRTPVQVLLIRSSSRGGSHSFPEACFILLKIATLSASRGDCVAQMRKRRENFVTHVSSYHVSIILLSVLCTLCHFV